MTGSRKVEMHKEATRLNFIIAMSLIISASYMNTPEVLNTLIANGVVQGVVSGGFMWANKGEHDAKSRVEALKLQIERLKEELKAMRDKLMVPPSES